MTQPQIGKEGCEQEDVIDVCRGEHRDSDAQIGHK
jgi:hypothetical protein